MAVDTGNAREYVSSPGEVYLATDRIKALFSGVPEILHVDDRYPSLRGENMRDLLEACGAVRCLRPVEDSSLSEPKRQALRRQAGHAETSGYKDRITDWSLFGLRSLLDTLRNLPTEDRRTRARLLWDELSHLEERRGKGVFTAEYSWTHYGSYRTTFDSAFVRVLNSTEWVPDVNGNLQRPDLVLFDTIGWMPNPFLLSKIRFKPPIIEQLAREAGIEPGVLDLLKKHGVTSVADLVARLGLGTKSRPEAEAEPKAVGKAPPDSAGDASAPVIPYGFGVTTETANDDGAGIDDGPDVRSESVRASGASARGGRQGDEWASGAGQNDVSRTPGSPNGRPFISYVAAHHDDEESDPDGLDQQARMTLETMAIDFILSHEPDWRRTAAHNVGYNLYRVDDVGNPETWCEVKAMAGGLEDRPVGMSRAQFECAQRHGESYWLYVVEHAGDEHARIVRVRDPAGKARTLTFDRGWLAVALLGRELNVRDG
jgi:hypothetical protein